MTDEHAGYRRHDVEHGSAVAARIPSSSTPDSVLGASEQVHRPTTSSTGRGNGALERSSSRPEPLERTVTSASSVPPLYSVFTRRQKFVIVFMASWAGFFSPISGQIYLPALNTLARDLSVSNTLINLTLTSYMIFQGLAPTFIGDIADTMGRRPAYAICFVVYIAANIGLALQDSYAALFILRCVQSSGSSGTIAMASGVVADIATAAERGAFMGYTLAGSLLGPAIGPVLGGVLSQYLGWRAIFWFLTIMGAAFLITFAVFFPETARTQVGDGSVPPSKFNMSLMNWLAVRKARHAEAKGDIPPPDTSRFPPRPKARFPNPLSSLRLLFDKLNACLLFYNAFLFSAFYQVSSSIPSQFQEIYSFNDFHIGLCFIPYGVGAISAALINGQLLDRNFARWCKRLDVPIRKGRQMDLSTFPIERCRLQIALPAIYVTITLILVFGWVLHYEGPLAVQLVILFFQSLTMSMAFNVTSTLIVDYYPGKSATATAANNLVRCLLGAGATAAIIPMIETWGRGPAFSALVGFLLIMSPMVWVVYLRGQRWREERRVREEAEAKRKQDLNGVVAIEDRVGTVATEKEQLSVSLKGQTPEDAAVIADEKESAPRQEEARQSTKSGI